MTLTDTEKEKKYEKKREILWIVLGGWLLWFLYALFGTLYMVSIIGIPFGLQVFSMLPFIARPHGKEANPLRDSDDSASAFNRRQKLLKTWESPACWAANSAWILLAGFVLAVVHLVSAFLNLISVVGIDNASKHLEMIPVSFAPFGRIITQSSIDIWRERPRSKYIPELSPV